MSIQIIKTLFVLLAIVATVISGLAIVDGLTIKPTDGLIWRLGHDRVIVESVVPLGPGLRAGIKKGDLILGINHILVRNPGEAASILMKLDVGYRVPYLIQRDDDILTVYLTPQPYRTGDHRLLYNALVGLVFLGVGLYTFLRRPNFPPARVFLLMNLCFVLVLTCSFRGSPYYWIDLIVQNAASWGLAFLGPLFLHFFLLFPSKKRFLESFSPAIPAIYLIPFIRHLSYTLSQYFGGRTVGREFFGIQLELWAILGIYLIAGVFALTHSYLRNPDLLGRRQIKLVLWGTVIGLCPFMGFSILGAGIFGRRELFSLGVLPLMAIPLSFAYTIIRYRLLEIQVIVKRSLLYSLLTGLFIGIYIIIVNGLGGWVDRVTPFGGGFFGILFVLLIAISFEPSRARLQKFINRLFYRSDYSRQVTLNRLTDSLRSFSEMKQLAEATLQAIDDIFQPAHASLAIITDRPGSIEVSRYTLENSQVSENILKLDEHSPEDLQPGQLVDTTTHDRDNATVHIGGVHSNDDDRPPERLELPIFSHQKMVGLLSLESKRTGEVYTLSELSALESFSSQAGLAIENIQLLNSIFETNQRLFEAEKLVSLGQLASGVAHEIRNPLSSIKLNIQGLVRNLQPDATNSKRLEIIQREIDHLDRIVHDVLIYARPSGLKIEAVDIREVLIGTLDLLSPQLKEYEHKVILNLPEKLPLVAADRDKLHQVCKNLITNAADAMVKNGRLEIAAQDISAQMELMFSDDGLGIPKKDISSIFNPFFTTKADGTGLGLANAQKFIKEMGGEITVDSEPGHGAEFIVTLPLSPQNSTE